MNKITFTPTATDKKWLESMAPVTFDNPVLKHEDNTDESVGREVSFEATVSVLVPLLNHTSPMVRESALHGLQTLLKTKIVERSAQADNEDPGSIVVRRKVRSKNVFTRERYVATRSNFKKLYKVLRLPDGGSVLQAQDGSTISKAVFRNEVIKYVEETYKIDTFRAKLVAGKVLRDMIERTRG